ncbi:MAG: hypothetical protein EU547_07895 [Promethearchaeota archaeon]|nr:MAG: hypothetical protein EU547_07895 [Candidatus Lokiarchaeota archaeon]
MSKTDPEYLKYFGEIKFAEQNSMSANDFESSLKRYIKKKDKFPRGRYKFAELNSNSINDFEESFNDYFE